MYSGFIYVCIHISPHEYAKNIKKSAYNIYIQSASQTVSKP